MDGPLAADLRSVADHLLRRTVWIVGGDGWAYDIGSGGLDHVLASGRNVNVLVLDTEVYSNTGGQSSKSTPIGAVAKFAAAGKSTPKKDLALQAIAYGNVYVARVAMGADPHQTLTAFREAEAYDGPSLVIAYSHCIAHGIEMSRGMDQQYLAVASGHWPLVRYDPAVRAIGGNPFQLDSPRPRVPLGDYLYNELRYRMVRNADPEEAERLLALAQAAVDQRWRHVRGDGDPRRRPLRRRREEHEPMTDLSTTYLGLALRNPLVASSSPATLGVDRVRALADAGIGAIVLPSLFEEQVTREQLHDLALTEGTENSDGEASSYFPSAPTAERGRPDPAPAPARAVRLGGGRAGGGEPQRQHRGRVDPVRPAARRRRRRGRRAQRLRRARRPGDERPRRRGPARRGARVGARGGRRAGGGQAEPLLQRHRRAGARLDRAGADGLVLFNRFLQPDVDTETLRVTTGIGPVLARRGAAGPHLGRDPAPPRARLARRRRPGSRTPPTSPPTSSPVPTSS